MLVNYYLTLCGVWIVWNALVLSLSSPCLADTDPCESYPCLNAATCVSGGGRYLCLCLFRESRGDGTTPNTQGDTCGTSVAANCGDTFSKTSGEILSPSYPGNYPSQQECAYLVRVLDADAITFSVHDLEVESGNDFIYIGKGPTIDIELEGSVAITSAGMEVTVDTDQAWVYFHSSENTNYRGFNITYIADTNQCRDQPCQQGGTCIDLVYAYECTCKDGWTGDNCTVGLLTSMNATEVPSNSSALNATEASVEASEAQDVGGYMAMAILFMILFFLIAYA